MKKETQWFTSLDIYLSAFLLLQGIQPNLENHNGKVIFRFPVSHDLYKQMTSYSNNEVVCAADFVTAIKTLRGQMLTMRGKNNG